MESNLKEGWKSRSGVILAVAASAIGLGNYLRFPGQAVQNGGGAFMVPYIISFLLLGIPVCLSEWIMGRMGGRYGHSAPFIFRNFLSGFPLQITSTIAVIIPLLIYVYYVLIEAWCLSYAADYIFGMINLNPDGIYNTSPVYKDAVIANAGSHFTSLTGSSENGAFFDSRIIVYIVICYLLNFLLVYRGIARGVEFLAKIAVPILLVFSFIILGRVISLDGITLGLGRMWNPDWSALLRAEVWINAAGQIFFSLSVGFGIVLSFSSYLKKKDDVTLSGLSAATLNEFVEVALGGMITIPIGFLFLGSLVTNFGTFGMGFIALPSVFEMMPIGNLFGAIWFIVLFIAALTSSVTMIQPCIVFLEEGFRLKRKMSIPGLFIVTFLLTLLIAIFNKDFTALDQTDFWVGTFLIYILATIQVIIYGWVIGPERAYQEGHEGALWKIPKIFNFVIKYITPAFLLAIFLFFLVQSLPGTFAKMSGTKMSEAAIAAGKNPVDAIIKADIAFYVFLTILAVFIGLFFLVRTSIKHFHYSAEERGEGIKS